MSVLRGEAARRVLARARLNQRGETATPATEARDYHLPPGLPTRTRPTTTDAAAEVDRLTRYRFDGQRLLLATDRRTGGDRVQGINHDHD